MRWIPFSLLVVLAAMFEPIRSGFVLANQACEFFTDQTRVLGSLLNLRHLIGYGVLFLAAAIALRGNRLGLAAIGIFALSIALEIEQSFFVTGHCRAWDLIPNALGIAMAATLVRLSKYARGSLQRSN